MKNRCFVYEGKHGTTRVQGDPSLAEDPKAIEAMDAVIDAALEYMKKHPNEQPELNF